MEQQRFRMIQRKKLLVSQSFRKPPVGNPSTRSVFLPEHQISVLARAGDKFRGVRNRDRLNLVSMAAQDTCFGPIVGVPEANGLICGRRNQLSSCSAEYQLVDPGGVAIQPDKELAVRSIPNTDAGIFVSRAGGQQTPVCGESQGSQSLVPLRLIFPNLLAGGEINALYVVTGIGNIRTRHIQVPRVR